MTASSASSMFDIVAPSDLGLPGKFARFRQPQRQALDWLNGETTGQIAAACLPTGAGKTLIAVALARLLGVKLVYLVATKALQQQVLNDFEPMGMAAMYGRASYDCPNYGNCANGYDQGCSLDGTTGCPRRVALSAAQWSDLVVTNYACWLHNGRRAFEGDWPVGLLVCDEAHSLEGQLTGFASVKIYACEFGKNRLNVVDCGVIENPLGAGTDSDSDKLIIWAQQQADLLAGSDDDDEKDLRERCLKIARMGTNWVWQANQKGDVEFSPIRVSGFAAGLFAGVARVLLMSASLNNFTLDLVLPRDLGRDYRVWGPVFPTANAPVYHIPTRKLSWKSDDEDYQAILDQLDGILAARSDRRALVQTVSYARMRRLLARSKQRDRFVYNDDAQDAIPALRRFRDRSVGQDRWQRRVLVSPSFSTGFDFPGDDCETQIVIKFPFPNENDKLIFERCKQIPGYRLAYAAQEIVQMVGRIRRYEQDRGETFILDNAVRQLMGNTGKSYCPPGFRIFTVTAVPPAPPKINPQEKIY